MIRNLLTISALLLFAGGFRIFLARTPALIVNQSLLEKIVPERVGDFQFLRSTTDAEQSYATDADTYAALNPLGLVSRVFDLGGDKIDTVVVAGAQRVSLHDPRWCFKSQGWEITDDRECRVNTRSKGPLTLEYLQAEKDGQKALVLFTFRGPRDYSPSLGRVRFAVFRDALIGRGSQMGFLLRFVCPSSLGEAHLKNFAGEYIDCFEENLTRAMETSERQVAKTDKIYK